MKAYKISDLKQFMNKLLLSEGFDYFLLEECTIITYNTFQVDGRIRKEFFDKEEQGDSSLCPYEFSLWKDMRPLCLQLIKGKRTPLSFKFVFLLLPEQMRKLLSSEGFDNSANLLKAFTLTIKYDGSLATLTTGISTTSFLMDKSPEQVWDKAFRKFMENRQIAWEEL